MKEMSVISFWLRKWLTSCTKSEENSDRVRQLSDMHKAERS